ANAVVRRNRAGRRVPAGTEGGGCEIPRACNPGSRLPRGLAWPEELERRRHTCAQPGSDGDAPRPTGRSRGCAQPLHRGRGRWDPDWLSVFAQRKSRPGPKFDYKLRWFDRLASHSAELLATGTPVVLAGDFKVMLTELDVYKPENWVDDALFRPEV